MSSTDVSLLGKTIPESDEADRVEQSIPVDDVDDGIDDYPHAAEVPDVAEGAELADDAEDRWT